MGCFEDYIDFREEVDRIKMKDWMKEKPMPVLRRSKDKSPKQSQSPLKKQLF